MRFALGGTLLVLGVGDYVSLAWLGIGQAQAGEVLSVIGLILLVTAATRTCLIYATLDLCTADRSTEEEATAGKLA